MGAKLLEFYDKAKAIGGMKATMRLAVITKLPSSKAGSEEDSPENIKKFEESFKEIEKEFK